MYDLGIIGGEVYINGELVKTNLYINNDHIVAYNSEVMPCKDRYVVDGCQVFPGLIDPHVHFQLGLANISADDFYTGSITAAYGGVTTFIDFLDPVSKAGDMEKAFRDRSKKAAASMIDYKFHATVKNPVGEVDGIVDEMKRLGINSVKLFTTYSDSGRRTYDPEILQLLKRSREGFIVLVHAEKDDLIRIESDYRAADLPVSRPEKAETQEALHLAEMVEKTGGKLYMVHTSSGHTLKSLLDEHGSILGKRFIVESCPQYFWLTEDKLKEEDGALFTCAPPLRTMESVALLREQIKDVNTIGTDHCPFMRHEKEGKTLAEIAMGIGTIEHAFSLMYTLFGEYAVKKMSVNPAKVFGMYPQKGSLKLGSHADIMIYDPRETRLIDSDHSNCDYTPYRGIEVKGKVVATINRGQFVIKDGSLVLGSVGHWIRSERTKASR